MKRLQGKRITITQIDAFMGKDLVALFQSEGADVIADRRDLRGQGAVEALITESGQIDVLIANLAAAQPRTSLLGTDDGTFRAMYEAMVFPLHRLIRGVLSQMIARRHGKIVVIGSASALRGMPNYSAYGSARGAQLAYVQDVGTEVARHSVHVNAIAQTFVENATYFPENYQKTASSRSVSRVLPSADWRIDGNRPRWLCFLPVTKAIFSSARSSRSLVAGSRDKLRERTGRPRPPRPPRLRQRIAGIIA